MRSLFPFRRESDLEWLGGRYSLKTMVREDDSLIHPDALLWLELPRGVIVASTLSDPRDPVSFVQSLEDAMKNPGEGAPRTPSRIRVSDPQLAEELRSAIDIPVTVAPVPELDEAFADLDRAMDEPDEPSYLAGGISSGIVGRLFSVSSVVFRMSPWRRMVDSEVLRIDIPQLDLEGACLSVIGAAGESFGFLLFPSVEAFEAFVTAPPEPSEVKGLGVRARNREPDLRSLSFEKKRHIPPSMLSEIKSHRWPVAGAKAYPSLFIMQDSMPILPDERDYRIMTACAAAFSAFFARHESFFETGAEEEVCESFTDDDDVMVTITAPCSGAELFLSGHDGAEEAILEGAPSMKVGRNEPCPCGSGKKYKRCHLGIDDAATQPASAKHPLHELDNRLAVGIVAFGIERFGFEPRELIEEMFGSEETMLQMAIPWLAYCERFEGHTLSEWFLDAEGRRLKPIERGWLEAQARAWLSVWDVVDIEPGRGLHLADLLTGERRFVHEISGSRSARPRSTMLARVVDFEGESLICGMYPMSMDPQAGADVVSSFRRLFQLRKKVSPETLRRLDAFGDLLDLWEDAIDDAYASAEGRQLANTDGDPFIHTKEQYRFRPADRDEVIRRIGLMEWAELEEGQKSVFMFARPDTDSDDEFTIVARIAVGKKGFNVETNSVRRADEMRSRLEVALGELASFHTRVHEDPMSSSRSPSEELVAAPPDPEVQARLVQYKNEYYDRWLDDSIPALKGKTPRQVAQGRGSKDALINLLKSIEHGESMMDSAERFDVGRLYKALGLRRS